MDSKSTSYFISMAEQAEPQVVLVPPVPQLPWAVLAEGEHSAVAVVAAEVDSPVLPRHKAAEAAMVLL
jgi:hypothetical protein